MTIFVQGLMAGANDMRAQAAFGLGDLVKLTSAEALRPFVTLITGPLIRVMGDKVPEVVRSAILSTLCDLLSKVPALLKPFLPQLQRTFIKCLADLEEPKVRELGAQCMSILIVMQTRLDPLAVELVTGIKNNQDIGIKRAMLKAMFACLNTSRENAREINAANKQMIKDTLLEILFAGSKDQSQNGL
jgi:translation initiation factor 1 (eIF-1/SUI1)